MCDRRGHGGRRGRRAGGGDDRRALRRPRRARLQRRDRRRGIAADARRAGVGRRPADESHRRVSHGAGGDRAPGRAARGDRHGLVGGGDPCEPGLARVLRVEGRSRDADPVHRGRPRAGGRPRELRVPRLGTDADGRRGDGRARRAARHRPPGRLRRVHGRRAAPARRLARRGRGARRLAPVRRGVLRQRRRAADRRRSHAGRRRDGRFAKASA